MNLGVVQPSDLLRTGGAVFLLTRKSKLLKFLGLVWLGGEIYTLAVREKGVTAGPTVAEKIAGGPDVGVLPALPREVGAGLPQTESSALAGLLGYAG